MDWSPRGSHLFGHECRSRQASHTFYCFYGSLRHSEKYARHSCGYDPLTAPCCEVYSGERGGNGATPEWGYNMKRLLAIGAASIALALGAAVPANAAPSFGPGNPGGGEGNSGPQGAKCHPPGQTTTTPGCK